MGIGLLEFRKANLDDLPGLSASLLGLLDRSSDFYFENVTKFGIPDEYVRRAFSEGSLRDAATRGSKFYLAFEGGRIVGFCQVIPKGEVEAELDRIVVFPGHTGKGIGSRLLEYALAEQAREGTREVTVYAGKHEGRARAFYEKNGFGLVGETSVDAPWGRRIELAAYKRIIQPAPYREENPASDYLESTGSPHRD